MKQRGKAGGMWKRKLAAASLILAVTCGAVSARDLEVSVYATAGDILAHMRDEAGRQQVLDRLEPLGVTRLFLEGRRGDEYVAPAELRRVAEFFQARGIRCSGGIATVPGEQFGARQTGGLGWLNWESQATQRDVARFFTENSPLSDELIVDDFFCTGDTSAEAERRKGERSWGQYRRELLVSLIEPLMFGPSRAAAPEARLIIKFPQWYDRFQLFGYDVPAMAAPFSQVWVGTEVRDPATRRMGYVQPTEGYINFLWVRSVAGARVRGAWFDHIECSAQNFLDQAYMSVLAGARELTLFRLGDVMEEHVGDRLLGERLSELRQVAGKLAERSRTGMAFYKPPGSEGDDNFYLADYLAMMGLPVLPVATYPVSAKSVFLPVQAAADSGLEDRMREHLRRGATLVLSPALLRRMGPRMAGWAGVVVDAEARPLEVGTVRLGDSTIEPGKPLQVEGALRAEACEVMARGESGETEVPLVTQKRTLNGRMVILNMRTFSEADFREAGEYLLAPKSLGWPELPEVLAHRVQELVTGPEQVPVLAPSGVALVRFEDGGGCGYNFRGKSASLRIGEKVVEVPGHGLAWW